jgi:hypothetical protein
MKIFNKINDKPNETVFILDLRKTPQYLIKSLPYLIIIGLSITLFFKQEKLSRLADTIKVKEMEIYTKDLCIDILSRGAKAIQSECETGDFIYR